MLPPVVRRFARTNQETHLTLVHRSSEALAEQVSRGDLDMGIVTLPVGREDLEEQDLGLV